MNHSTMQRQLTITADPIDEGALVSRRTMSAGMGAAVYFAGVVRAFGPPDRGRSGK